MAGITIPLITEFKDTGIKQAVKQFKKLETAGEKAQFALRKAAVPAAAALAGVATAIGLSVAAAVKDQAAQASLARQITASTGATAKQIKGVEQYISSLGQSVAISDDEARPAFQRLVVATKDVTKAQALLNLAIDVSAATGKDLTTVSEALAKGYAGNMRALQALSPELKLMIKDGASLSEVQEVLTENFGGAGVAAANTAAGGMKKLTIAFDETKESIGTAFLPVFERLLPVVQKFSRWAEKNPTLLASVVIGIGAVSVAILAFNAVQALTIALNTALTASFTALYVATGVIIIIAIIAAIVALQAKFNILGKGVNLLKGIFNTLWGTVKTVFNWIAANWPSLLAILTGPFGLAVYAIIKFKDSIVGILLGIKRVAGTIFDNIIGAYRTVMNGVLGLMESGINKAITGLNAALDAVDAAAGPLINFGNIDPVVIPRLAEGGIVTSPTLALIGEAGPEAVIPLNRGGGVGGNNYITINVSGADPQAVVRALQAYNRTAGPVPVNTRAN